MSLLNPWENIGIDVVLDKASIQFNDNSIHIIYVLSGQMTVEYDGQFVTVSSGNFLILEKITIYKIYLNESVAFVLNLKYYGQGELDNNYIFFGGSVTNPHEFDRTLINKINKLLKLYLFEESKQSLAEILENYYGIINLLEKIYRKKVNPLSVRQLQNRIEEIKFFIDNNFEKEIYLSDLAQKLFVSEHYLSRQFSSETGMTFREYILKKRLDNAKKELIETDVIITDIAFSSGFTNINSFNRIFKRSEKMTPTQYREVNKKKNVPRNIRTNHQMININELKKLFKKDMSSNHKDEEIIVNTNSYEKINFKKNMINLGYASDLMHYSFVEQMKYLKKEKIFKYGRIWGLLSEEIVEQVGDKYDFSAVDEILKEILNAGLKPFIDLGLKGKFIFETHRKIIKKESYVLKSNDMKEILRRIKSFFKHCIDLFGIEEVSSWKIEIWKPNKLVLENSKSLNLSMIIHENQNLNITEFKNFVIFFSCIKKCVQEIVPCIKVGGCGFSVDIESEDILSLINYWKNQKEKPDFISLSIYPMDEIKQNLNSSGIDEVAPISLDEDYMMKKVMTVSRHLKDCMFDVELYITEFNVTLLNRDIINDTSYKGNYIIKNVLSSAPYCDLLGYWQFSDLSTTTFDTSNREIYGSSGLISKSGIPKVGYFAYLFLNQLGEKMIYKNNHIIVTCNDSDDIQILSYYYAHLNATYYYNTKNVFNIKNAYSIFDEEEKITINVKFQDIGKDKDVYQVEKHSIGRNNGNLLEEIQKASSEDNLSSNMIEYLKHQCCPTIYTKSVKVDKNNCMEIDIEVKAHEFQLFKIKKINT